MFKRRTMYFERTGPLLLCLLLVSALLIAAGTPPAVQAQCECDDGYCDSVGRAYFEFGERITENCTFTADVSRPSGANSNGFTIGANGITINGAYHCLDGVTKDSPVIKGSNGIFAGKSIGAYDVTIKNLEIKNFWQGIKLRGNGSSDPITGIVVDNCIIHDNGVSGDTAKYEGIWLDVAEDCTVQNCTIYNNNQGSGIANGVGDSNSFISNEIYGNYKHGIKAWWDSWYLYAANNDVHDNGWGGINHKSGSNYGTIEYNTCTNNTGPGIQGGKENYFTGNISSDNVDGTDIDPETGEPYDRGIGIKCSPNDIGDVYVEDNIACGNEYYDIYMGDDINGIGYYNTCNTIYNFNDSGDDGCTYLCDTGFPVAKFYAEDTMVCGDAQFRDQSLCADGSTLSWEWDFGDGSAHSYAQEPLHTYADSGVYTVSLTVTMSGGESGTDDVTKEDYITACPYPGDLDGDSDVDGTDYCHFYASCIAGGQPGWCDINGDSSINGDDMAMLGMMGCISCPQ
jgi:parallel beta-helix repeat protein